MTTDQIEIQSGGVDIKASRVEIDGDVVGRDKIVQTIQHIYERSLTATEEAKVGRDTEQQYLAEGVSRFAQNLRNVVTASAEVERGDPYKGLLEYHLGDAERFFGRTQATQEFVECLNRHPLTVLHSESGAGKTSLLQAGIAPQLIMRGDLPINLRPNKLDPILKIKRNFLPELQDTPGLAKASLRGFLQALCTVLGSTTTVYIFLDQFEEFFIHLDETTRTRFIDELAECLEDDSLNVRWVLSIRREYFSDIANFAPRIHAPLANQYRLNRMARAEAAEAITKPGIIYEGGLVETILTDLDREAGEERGAMQPPQIQLVCAALYAQMRHRNETSITRATYAELQGVTGILQGHLHAVFEQLPRELWSIAHHLLEALVTSSGRRAQCSWEELNRLIPQETPVDAVRDVLQRLLDLRLLRSDTIDDRAVYELAQEYVVNEIVLDPAVQARKAAQELIEHEVALYRDNARHKIGGDELTLISRQRETLAFTPEAAALYTASLRWLRLKQRTATLGVLASVLIFLTALVFANSAYNSDLLRQSADRDAAIAKRAATTAEAQKAASDLAVATSQAVQRDNEAKAATAAANEVLANQRADLAIRLEQQANQSIQSLFQRTGIVPIGLLPSALVLGGNQVWVASSQGGALQAVDSGSGHANLPISFGTDILNPAALAYYGDRVWFADEHDKAIKSVDPISGRVSEIIKLDETAGIADLVSQDGVFWVVTSPPVVVRAIDPTSLRVTKIISTNLASDYAPTIAIDGQRAWITKWMSATDNSAVVALDLSTGEIVARLTGLRAPSAIVFDGRLIWVADASNSTLKAIDPQTLAFSQTIPVHVIPSALAFDGLRLWIASRASSSVQSLNPATGWVGPIIPVGRGPAGMAVGAGRLWIANTVDGTLKVIDVTAGDVSEPILVGSGPASLALENKRLWVANAGDATLQAIDLDSDTAQAPVNVGVSLRSIVFDGTSIWGTSLVSHTVVAFDPARNEVRGQIPVDYLPFLLGYDELNVWIVDTEKSSVQSIDRQALRLSNAISFSTEPLLIRYGSKLICVIGKDMRPVDFGRCRSRPEIPVNALATLASDGRWLWSIDAPQSSVPQPSAIPPSVRANDLVTGRDTLSVTVSAPVALAFDGKQLWVADFVNGIVVSVEPDGLKVTGRTAVGEGPQALLFDGKRLWVANSSNNTIQYIALH